MRKSIIVLITLAVLLSAAVFAGPPQVTPPYPTGFWMTGTLNKGEAPDAENYKVVVYSELGEPVLAFAFDYTAADGSFIINAHDDLRLLPLVENDYYIGVVSKSVDGNDYGVDEMSFNLQTADLENGYKVIDVSLTLKEGAGIEDPGGEEEFQILTTSLLDAYVGVEYLAQLEVSEGQTPYTWSIDPDLPASLSLDSVTGLISGTPDEEAEGDYLYTFVVSDSSDPQQEAVPKEISFKILPEEAPPAQLADTGRIRNTNIVREGKNLKITWGFDDSGPTSVKIYTLTAAGATYSAVATDYNVNPDIVIDQAVTEHIYSNTGKDGSNYYYRVVPEPLITETNILDDKNNSITVGKVEIALPADKYVFTALPFQEDSISLEKILGEQVANDGEFLWWDGTAYKGATYVDGWTGENRLLRIGEGFILRAKTDDASVALVGRFGKLTAPFKINLVASQYILLGNSYPTVATFSELGVIPDPESDLLKWDVGTQAYLGATFSDGDWVGSEGINSLELSQPRYYRPKENDVWQIQ